MAKPPNLTNRASINPEELYLRLGQLLETVSILDQHPVGDETHRWVARALVLVDAAGDLGDYVQLKSSAGYLGVRGLHEQARTRIVQIVHNALARAEVSAPVSLQGSFLPAGNTHDALVAVSKVLAEAKKEILLVDPYADASILNTYAIQAAPALKINILSDAASVKPGLKPAVVAWTAQYGTSRVVDVRLAPKRALHDRLIAVDGLQVWVLGQSFNALAARSPTAVTRLDEETARLKLAAYLGLWASAAPL